MLIFIVGLAATAYMMNALNANTIKIERDKKTTDALAEAKEALIGWAVKRNTPGQMPCPEDTTKIGLPTEGQAQSSCTLPAIGRLPWHTLGIGDIRDGNGDKLWYALSAGFRTGIINSDTPAQLTVDGTAGKAVAIIFSPGPVLIGQSRSVPTAISPPDVTQYLDLSNNDGDNTFVSTGAAASFNDHLLLIDHDKLFRVVEKRVAREALNCLEIFAAGSGGKYPWPAKLDPSAVVDYTYDVGTLFGRLPDSPMGGAWSGACNIPVGGTGWWLSWKEQVFFTVADEYKPTGAATVCGACLAVNPPSASGDKKIVVIVAGKALTGQSRTSTSNKGTLSNYLEFPNSSGGVSFAQQQATSTFNDVVVYH